MSLSSHHMDGYSSLRDVSTSAFEAPFDAYVVLDFEATCERGVRIQQPEIIEFPFVVVDPVALTIVGEYQRYVRPVVSPKLTDFCTDLTGITQAQVDCSETFPTVYADALRYLSSAGFGDAPPSRSYCLVTCGDWDLKTMLPSQLQTCANLGLRDGNDCSPQPPPVTFQRWCNIKKYMNALQLSGTERKPYVNDMVSMLDVLGLPLQGRQHSGIDDCRNIAAALIELLRRQYPVRPTWVPRGQQPPFWRTGGNQLLAALPVTLATPTMCSVPPAIPTGSVSPSLDGTQKPSLPGSRKKKRRVVPLVTANALVRVEIIMDNGRDAVEELLRGRASGGSGPRFSNAKSRTLSKALSYILRHGADEKGISMSKSGFVSVQEVLCLRPFSTDGVTEMDLAELVHFNDKQRYRLAFGATDGRLYIAASQGHSLPGICPDLRRITSAEEVPVAVHGTYHDTWRQIRCCGYLSSMSRQHIHFSRGLMGDVNVVSGMRYNAEVFLYLDVAKVLADGIKLWESANGVILTPGVGTSKHLPLTYILKVVSRDSGEELPVQ